MSKEQSQIGGNAIIYRYANGDFDIICSANKHFVPAGYEAAERYGAPAALWSHDREGLPPLAGAEAGEQDSPAPRQKGKKSEGEDRVRSMRRARAKLRRLALANEFEWFVTLTLDPAKVDRYDPAAIMKTVNRWLDNMVRRHGLRYILVPEQHRDGAYHFHGFFAGEVEAVPSGHRDPQGHEYFNLPQWSLGFTTAVRLYGTYSAAVAYCCKYIGKQDGQRPMGRWYYSGGRLAEPTKLYTTLEYSSLGERFPQEAVEFSIPGTQLVVVHHRKETQDIE